MTTGCELRDMVDRITTDMELVHEELARSGRINNDLLGVFEVLEDATNSLFYLISLEKDSDKEKSDGNKG